MRPLAPVRRLRSWSAEESRRRAGLAVPVACIGFFIVVLDTTVVNLALPSIGRDLGGGISGLQWVVDGYTVAFAALVLSAGHVSDRTGASASFGRGLCLFALSSAWCGLSPTLTVLLIARICQGAAAALMLPASLALVGQAHPGARERARAIGFWASAGGAAVAAGPVLGGVITQTLGWRAVFFINVPIAAAALLALRRVPISPRRPASLDLGGQLSVILALGALTFGVIEGERLGFGSPEIILAFSVFVLASAAFVLVERVVAEPAVPLKLLATREAAGTLTAGLALYFGFYGVIFVLSLFFQRVLRYGPALSGLMFLPMTALITVATTRTAAWTHRSGAWVPLVVGLTLMFVGAVGLAIVGVHTHWWQIALSTIPVGVGSGIAGPAIPVGLLAAIPREQSGIAAGIANALRQVAATLGVAIFGALLAGQAHFVVGMQLGFLVSAAGMALGVGLILAWVRPAEIRHRAAEETLQTAL